MPYALVVVTKNIKSVVVKTNAKNHPNITQTSQSKNLFFSYAQDEYSELILKIREYFKKRKYNIAIDTEILYAGSGWEIRLEEAIEKNEKFIFVG